MPKITITGVDSRVDGSYDLDLDDRFTYGELSLIKKIAGARGAEISEAMEAGDMDIIVALTMVALKRAGQEVPVSRLMDAKVGAIEFGDTEAEREAAKAEAEEVAELPPAKAPSGAAETSSESDTGEPSTKNGSADLPETALPVIGAPTSLTGSG